MLVDLITKRTEAERLHDIATKVSNLKEANLVLQHRNCMKKTKQMVLAKILLFKRKKLRRALKKQENYVPEIIGTINGYLKQFENNQAATG